MRDPAILLLDEATSALDPGAEAAINRTIGQLAPGRTVISVTHRLASVTGMDQIYVMHKGTLVEQGTHRSLLERCGLYYELWQKQSGFEVSNDGRFAQIDAERLKQVHLFERSSAGRLAQFAAQFRSEFFEAGQAVIVQGEVGDKLYVIVRGTVDVFIKDETGKEHFLDCMEDGDYFGEMALLLNQPRSATIRTVTPSLLLSLSANSSSACSRSFRSAARPSISASPRARPIRRHSAAGSQPRFERKRAGGAKPVSEQPTVLGHMHLRRSAVLELPEGFALHSLRPAGKASTGSTGTPSLADKPRAVYNN